MAWRPYPNVIDGELDNRTPGKITGWIRFYRRGAEPIRVAFYLAGDFHEDIKGKVIRISNPTPWDRNEQLGRDGTYMEGFDPVQRGQAGDITAGLSLGTWTPDLAQRLFAQKEASWSANGMPADEQERHRKEFAAYSLERIASGEPYYPYGDYPYIEFYSDNGRVVLELDPAHVRVVGGDQLANPQAPRRDWFRREEAMLGSVEDLLKGLFETHS